MTLGNEFGPAGAALWESVTGDLELSPTELATLRHACSLEDRAAELEAAFADDPRYLVKGSMGQPVTNGLLSEIRQTRQAIVQALARIKVQADESTGRPSLSVLVSEGA